jgi:hypothetical protein
VSAIAMLLVIVYNLKSAEEIEEKCCARRDWNSRPSGS